MACLQVIWKFSIFTGVLAKTFRKLFSGFCKSGAAKFHRPVGAGLVACGFIPLSQ